MHELTKPKISVIGLGKLGSPMLAVFAHKGFEVIGVDLNSTFVDSINSGIAPVLEPHLQEMLSSNKDKISATTDIKKAISDTDICFVIVPTPSGENHFFSNDYVVSAVKSIGNALKEKDTYFNVVITSTVMPGSTGTIIKDSLENSSGRKIGKELGLCYNPEFIALGTVVRDMLNPDLLLIGQSDTKAGDMLEEVYKNSVDSNPECHRMNWVNAELCKIAVNTFVTTKISYANMIADMCDHLEGADSDIVTNALGSDSRIGKKYIKGGVAYGGPCFPRDNKAFAALGEELGVRTDLAKATDNINKYQTERLIKIIKSKIPLKSTITILGISYKPNTPVIEESQGLSLAKELLTLDYTVRLTDPEGLKSLQSDQEFKDKIFNSYEKAIDDANILIIMIPWKEYSNINFSKIKAKTVIDPWRTIDSSNLPSFITLVQPGMGDWKFE